MVLLDRTKEADPEILKAISCHRKKLKRSNLVAKPLNLYIFLDNVDVVDYKKWEQKEGFMHHG